MSIFSRLKGNYSPASSRVEPVIKADTQVPNFVEPPMFFGINPGLLSGGTTFSGVVVTPSTAMKSSTVYTCVTTIASSIAKMPLKVQALHETGGWIDAPYHPLSDLFSRPNSRDKSWFQFLNNNLIQYLLFGNAYLAIIRGRDGRPSELIGLDSGQVSVSEAQNGDRVYHATSKQFVGKKTSKANEDINGPSRTIFQDDMIHLVGSNLNNNIIGQSPVTLAAEVIGIDLAIQETRAGAFRNGVSLQYIIKTSGRYKPEQLQALRENLMKGIAGTANTGVGPALPPEVDLIPMNLSPRDLMLPEMGEESKRNVAMLWNFPPHKLGLDDKDAAASIEQKERTYISETLEPITKQFEQIVNDLLLVGDDKKHYRIKFDDTQLVMPVYKDRVDAGVKAVVSGLLSPNEWRADEGRPGYEGGDTIMRPLNTGAVGEKDGSETTPAGEMPTDNEVESEES